MTAAKYFPLSEEKQDDVQGNNHPPEMDHVFPELESCGSAR